MGIRGIGTAPVSFGIYGSVESSSVMPSIMLDAVVEAGFIGMELGPPGFFGTPPQTANAFKQRGLDVIAAYVPIHLGADDDDVTRDLVRMERSLAELGAGSPSALAILADEGSPELLSNPARPWDDRRHALDDRGWQRLISNVDRAVELAGRVGIPTSFHPHISTYVESPWEIDRLLGSTATFLTLDTGHFWLAGADPTEHLVRYGDRVNHIHLKDVRRSVLERAKAEGRSDFDAWWADVATPLGDGDVDLEGFIEALLQHGYDGWLVIEHDRLPLEHTSIDQVALEQARNRRWVERVLERLATAPGASTMGTA